RSWSDHQSPRDADFGTESRQRLGQSVRGGEQLRIGDRSEGIEDEERRPGIVAERCAAAMPPIPSSARHRLVIAPDDLPVLGVLDYILAVGDRIERLFATGPHKTGRTDVAAEVLAAERDLMEHGDRVVDIR